MQHGKLKVVCYFTYIHRGMKSGLSHHATHGWSSRTLAIKSEGASPSESYWLLPIITYADMAKIE